MRTTLTLDPDVQQLLEDAVHRERKPLKQIVNDALRRGLAPGGPARRQSRFRVVAHHTRLVPGVDHARLNSLADQLDDESIVAAAPRARRRAK